jgi:hypothetical protein
MEYRGISYQVVQMIDSGWRWSVKSGDRDKFGTALRREAAVIDAQRHIDGLIKIKGRSGLVRLIKNLGE